MAEYRLLKANAVKVDGKLQPAGVVTPASDQLGAWWVSQGIAERVVPKVQDMQIAPRLAPIPALLKSTPQPAARFKCCGWK